MPQIKQTFENCTELPLYAAVEPWPEVFELEPEEELTLVWTPDPKFSVADIKYVGRQELTIFPNGSLDDLEIWIGGQRAEDRAWTFKHNPPWADR